MKPTQTKANRPGIHRVTYVDTTDIACAVRAMQGRTTKAIARELNIPVHVAEYRINKAQKALKTYFRKDYRSGDSPIVQAMLAKTATAARSIVINDVAPKFRQNGQPAAK